jgi:cobalt-zinc-cadmium efflux system protein
VWAAPPRRARHHGPVSTAVDARASRALWAALTANAALLVAEVVGGLVFSSLALLADAAHLATDVLGLGVVALAQVLLSRPASGRRTFGLRRAEALGAQVNAVLVLGAGVWIVVEAAGRLGGGHHVDGVGVLVIAAIAVLVNGASAAVLASSASRRLNVRAALAHLVTDVAGSLAVVVAAVGIVAFGANWLDPVASLVIAALVAWATWGVLRDSTNVLLEGAPRDVKVGDVEQALFSAPGVEAVHHVHVWEVASDMPALSAHVVLTGAPSLHEAQVRGESLKTMLADRFGIAHATLELECHECDTPSH